MRISLAISTLTVVLAASTAQAEQGSFFKNLFSGDAKSGGETMIPSGPQAYDPSEPYCPPVSVADGGAAIQASSGGAGDTAKLRHQVTFARLSRECAQREDGSIAVKVGVEVRALLGPAGTSGRYDAPVTVSTQYNGTVLSTRSRRLTVTIPPGASSGTATMIETDLSVPQAKAIGYTIFVSLAAASGKPAPLAAKRTRKPAAGEAASTE